VKKLTIDKIVKRDFTIATKVDFEANTGIILSEIKYNKLRGIATTSIANFRKNLSLEKKTDTVQNYLMRIKKGSKRIREVFSGKTSHSVSQNMLKYAELTETIINVNNSCLINSSWSYSYLHNSTRTFIFKLHNGLLGLNSRVAHFVRNHPNTCTFCDLGRIPEENQETTKHLFFDCFFVENVIPELYTWIFNSPDRRFLTRTEFFIGFDSENIWKNRTLHVVNLLTKQYIWDCKLRFTLPRYENLKNSVVSDLKRMTKQNRDLKDSLLKSGLENLINSIRF